MTGEVRAFSVGQEALWLLHQLAPDSAAYHVLIAVRIRGRLDMTALAGAVAALAERHELVRSRVVVRGGGSGWSPCEPGSVRLDVHDLPGAGEAEVRRRAAEVSAEPFRLRDRPPLRVALFRSSPVDAVLLLVAHHLATDATSQWLLLRDLLCAYRARVEGGGPGWPELTGSYRDYVGEEQRLLASPRGERLAGFWRRLIAGLPPAELATDRPRPAVPRPAARGGACEWELAASLDRALAGRARQLKVTRFALLLGAFQSLLHRYTGAPEFLVGCPATVRLRPKYRDVVGYFVNPMPLPARFPSGTTLRAAVLAARDTVNDGVAHVRYPCARLSAGFRRSPLFRVAMTAVTPARAAPRLPMPPAGGLAGTPVRYASLDLSLMDLPQQEGQLDLLVELVFSEDPVRARFRYNADVLDPATVARLARDYESVVKAAILDPEQRVGRLPLVDRGETDRLLALGAGEVTDLHDGAGIGEI